MPSTLFFRNSTTAFFHVVGLLSLINWSAAADRAPAEARFERTVISRDMKDPMQFTLLGDGRIVVVDRMGTVHVIKKDGTSVPTIVPIYAVGAGKPNWEDGMIGIVADPDFSTNPYVYILHAVKGDEPKQHLMRYGFIDDQLDIASGKMVLEIKNCRTIIGHCGGCLSFAPGRMMFISTGDNTTPFESDGFSPLDARIEGKDARATSANSNDLRGKILRIHVKTDGTYDIPKGNLFPPGTANARPEIYVMGCRNPFRHHYDPVTGFLFWGEIGPDSGNDSESRGPRGHDEFNRAKAAGNFGWPLFVGNNKPYAVYDFDSKKAGEHFDPAKPINDSPRNTGIKELPPAQPAFFWYPNAASPEFPELGSGGRCAMGGPVYRVNHGQKSEDQFPVYYEGKWFIYDWMRQWVKVVTLDKNGNSAGSEDFAPNIKWKKPMDMKFGPDGALYVLEYGTNWNDNTDSQLSKVVFAGGNRAPIAMATADKFVGKDPLSIHFSSAGTDDNDEGDILTYAWDFAGKGSSSEANPSFTFKEPGIYNVILTVKDKAGKVGTAGVPIRVGNAEPVVKIVEPKAGAFFAWGKALAFKIDVSDDEDGSTTDGKLPVAKIQVSGAYQDGATTTATKGYEAAMLTGGSDKGRKLIGGSDCVACHQMQAQSVGPAFVMIAQKYHKQDMLGKLTQKVIDGGAGVWGPMAMAPHPQHTQAEVKEMVSWILSLADAPPPASGATGTLTVPVKPEKNESGVYVVTASYADKGAKGQASLTGTASIVLRSRHLKAAEYATKKGTTAEDCADEGKGKALGYINHDDFVSFSGIDLSATKAIEARLASAGQGGFIEIHAGSPTGKLVAKIEVTPTGDWQKWATTEAATVTDPGGTNDLFMVFKAKSGSGSGLFNLNWLHFVEK